jgi:hypothetical protein
MARERSISVRYGELGGDVTPLSDSRLGVYGVCFKCFGPLQKHLGQRLPCATCERFPRLTVAVPRARRPFEEWHSTVDPYDNVEFIKVETGIVVDRSKDQYIARRVWVRT